METRTADERLKRNLVTAQRNEITEHLIYARLARLTKDPHNRQVLEHIAAEEEKHYQFWKGHTGQEIQPSGYQLWKYVLIARVLGLTFGIKLMEKGEQGAQIAYGDIAKFIPGAAGIEKDEEEHEKELVALIDEERLRYVGSIVLGLNDALVELTGALAGFTFALQSTRLIAVAGLITGIAASFSMAASEYLSIKSEEGPQSPLRAAVYTGIAYIFTVAFLVFPFFIFRTPYLPLGLAVSDAIIVILAFSFYISVAKDIPFGKRFAEMALVSLGVAALSFAFGFLIRTFLPIDI